METIVKEIIKDPFVLDSKIEESIITLATGDVEEISEDSFHLTPEQIDELELEMLEKLDLIELPLHHKFSDGMYTRELYAPAGTLAVTAIHKTQHPFSLLSGVLSVYEPGKGFRILRAPLVGITEPGTRRIIYVFEDTVWATFHANPDDEKDIDKLESRLIEVRTHKDGTNTLDLYRKKLGEKKEKLICLQQ